MKFRIGALLLASLLAGCGGQGSDSWQAGLRGIDMPGRSPKATSAPARMAGASIANAPDRGKLVSYPQGTPAQKKGAFTWYPISVSEEHAFNAIASGEMTFPAPDGTQLRLRYVRHAEQLDGNWTWVGRVVGGDPRQEAIITFGERAVFGSIPQENGPPLSLQTRQGALWVVQMDPSKAAKPGIRGDTKVPQAAATAVRDTAEATATASTAMSGMVAALRAPQTDANTVDVAIGYTAGFATYLGGTSQATTRLAFLIEVGNQAFNNSNVDGYLRLVHTLQVSYTDTNANEAALDALTGTNGTQPVTIPSSLVPLRTARDQYSADIAILVRKFTTPENDGCGIAWLIGANQTPITSGDATYGYAVVSDGTDQGTDGFSYYCDDNTLSHESAHLMGSAHDRANALDDNNQLQYGRYPYSFGLKTTATTGNFYTIMAYGDPDQMPYRVFSNPNITFCGDRICGVANSEDNVRSLNQTIPIVATFRGAGTTPPASSPAPACKGLNDVNLDGRSDLMWSNPTLGIYHLWTLSGNMVTSAKGFPAGGAYDALASGDFNGDGRYDVLWRNRTNGALLIWERTATGYVTKAFSSSWAMSSAWRLAGTGDVNLDGTADLMWSNPTLGIYHLWTLSGNMVTSVKGFPAGSAYDALASGDFNGDGRYDVLWRNRNNGALLIWERTATGYVTKSFSSSWAMSSAWRLAGTGGVNLDGTADLMWSNPAAGQYQLWAVNAATVTSAKSFPAASSYDIYFTGDFNGDGRYDVLWRNRNNGALLIWERTTSGYTSKPFSSGWAMASTWKPVC